MRLPLALSLLLVLPAAEPPKTPPAKSPPASQGPTIREMLREEEGWQFAPPVGRPDILYDLETILTAKKKFQDASQKAEAKPSGVTAVPKDANEIPTAWAQAQKDRVNSLLAERKWNDAIKTAELAIKSLEAYRAHNDIIPIIKQLEQSRDQADEAQTREEAQVEFSSRALAVEGVLWSEKGQRLAIIAGEPKALGLNERVKDCVLINIDTDRVDFRFHYKRRRFEFPIYVGENAGKSLAARPAATSDR